MYMTHDQFSASSYGRLSSGENLLSRYGQTPRTGPSIPGGSGSNSTSSSKSTLWKSREFTKSSNIGFRGEY